MTEDIRDYAFDAIEMAQSLDDVIELEDGTEVSVLSIFTNEEVDILNEAFIESSEWTEPQLRLLIDIGTRRRR